MRTDGMPEVRKKGAVKNGPVRRVVKALCGPVEMERPRYRCPGCDKSFYAPNAFYDSLGTRSVTEGVWNIGLQLGVHVPYARTSQLLERFFGVKVSAAALHGEMVTRGMFESERVGKSAHDQATFRSLPDPAPPSVSSCRRYVEMDGCYVHRWCQKGSFELKVGSVFRDPVLEENRNRKWIEHKEYVGYFGDSETFGERLFSCGERWGISEAEELYVLGDGASWIRSLHSQYFPHGQLILDWWHVQKAVRTTVRSVVSNESQRQGYGDAITSALYEGDVDRALKMIEQLPRSTAKRREESAALKHYLHSNRHAIPNYGATKEQGIHIGSGVIENTCMDTVGRRMKHRGMGWTDHGAEAILSLRFIHLNGQWDDYWAREHPAQAA
jgi:hypothetical protein